MNWKNATFGGLGDALLNHIDESNYFMSSLKLFIFEGSVGNIW